MSYPLFEFAKLEDIEPRWTAEDAQRQAERLNREWAGQAIRDREAVLALVDAETMKEYDYWVRGNTDPAYLHAYWMMKLRRLTIFADQIAKLGISDK